MELKLKIGYKELLDLIKQLPSSQLVKLKAELSDDLIEKKSQNEQQSFQELLLNGPVMEDEQYQQFLDHRNAFNQWRMN